MKRRIIFAMLLFSLSGCAETRLIQEEKKVLEDLNVQVSSTSDLKDQAIYSRSLSKAYQRAALRASRDQDAFAFVTIISAISVVGGALGSASDKALANRATVGATSSLVANRTLSKSTIKGIYISAKRMNCVATTASIGTSMLAEAAPGTQNAAKAATFGAIAEVQILSREALVRDVADYVKIRDELSAAMKKAEFLRSANTSGENFDLNVLNQYLKMLGNCLTTIDNLTAIAAIKNN